MTSDVVALRQSIRNGGNILTQRAHHLLSIWLAVCVPPTVPFRYRGIKHSQVVFPRHDVLVPFTLAYERPQECQLVLYVVANGHGGSHGRDLGVPEINAVSSAGRHVDWTERFRLNSHDSVTHEPRDCQGLFATVQHRTFLR